MAKKVYKFYDNIEELPELEGWSTVPQVAERFGVSRQRVNQWVLEGRFLGTHRISEVILISETDIDDFAERSRGKPIRAQSKPAEETPYR